MSMSRIYSAVIFSFFCLFPHCCNCTLYYCCHNLLSVQYDCYPQRFILHSKHPVIVTYSNNRKFIFKLHNACSILICFFSRKSLTWKSTNIAQCLIGLHKTSHLLESTVLTNLRWQPCKFSLLFWSVMLNNKYQQTIPNQSNNKGQCSSVTVFWKQLHSPYSNQ